MDLDSPSNEMTIEEARKILGKTAEGMPDEELQTQIVLIKSLAESWLDNYERTIFDGRTVNELLGQV